MPIVAFKRARVKNYGVRTLSGSGYEVNQSFPQANSLKQWGLANRSNGGTNIGSLSTTMIVNHRTNPYKLSPSTSAQSSWNTRGTMTSLTG